MSRTNQILRDSPWVQSPSWPEVGTLLEALNVGQTYYRRGSHQASDELDQTIEQHCHWVSQVLDLSKFPHRYLTSGATEGINQWRMTDSRDWQFLAGDYQWPQLISGNGCEVDVDRLSRDKVLYVSNPSCRDGNFLRAEEIDKINAAGCPVVLDCAYLGATALRQIPVFENTEQILFSFSKGWGLVGQRVGLLYCRTPHPTLKHMRRVECWNYQTAPVLRTIMNHYAVDAMHTRAFPTQLELCSRLDFAPSDTYFLATSTNPYFEKQMRVQGVARLSLTPIWPNDLDLK